MCLNLRREKKKKCCPRGQRWTAYQSFKIPGTHPTARQNFLLWFNNVSTHYSTSERYDTSSWRR
jgi:hypothetical protein